MINVIEKQLTPAQIARRNRRFAKLNRGRQRMAIAQEVIDLEARKMMAIETGIYCHPYNRRYSDKMDQLTVLDPQFECRVCHLGGAVIAAMRLGNRFEGTANQITRRMRTVIQKWFGERQAALMEVAFEGNITNGINAARSGQNRILPDSAARRALDFWEIYDHRPDRERSVAIWQNVIRNKGLFRPELEREQTGKPTRKSRCKNPQS